MGSAHRESTQPTPADDLYPRWQTTQLLGAVFAMVERGAPRADFEHERYDLAQLALRTIDFVVVNQASVDGSVGLDRILDHLTQAARRMAPDDPVRPWSRVAKLVLNSLLNDGRPHVATWREPAADGEGWSEARPFRFRLLRLVEGDTGAVVAATDEAIVLYLRALRTDRRRMAACQQRQLGPLRRRVQPPGAPTVTGDSEAGPLPASSTDSRVIHPSPRTPHPQLLLLF